MMTSLLPQLSAVAFPPDDASMHQSSRVHTDVLPPTASTPRAHEPPTPQPNRAPAPQPLNTEHPRPFPSSFPFSAQHYSQPPLPLNGTKLHETMRGTSSAGEGHWNKAVHFATSQRVSDPSLSMSDFWPVLCVRARTCARERALVACVRARVRAVVQRVVLGSLVTAL